MISGCNISNVLAFTPWVFLNLAGIFYAFILRFIPINSPMSMYLLSVLCGLIGTLVIIFPYNDMELIKYFVVDVFTTDWQVFLYMLITLVIGLHIIGSNVLNLTSF